MTAAFFHLHSFQATNLIIFVTLGTGLNKKWKNIVGSSNINYLTLIKSIHNRIKGSKLSSIHLLLRYYLDSLRDDFNWSHRGLEHLGHAALVLILANPVMKPGKSE